MVWYIIKRLLCLIPILLGVTLVLCLLMAQVPGGLSSGGGPGMVASDEPTPAERLGLSGTGLGDFVDYLCLSLLHLDLGTNAESGVRITKELLYRLPTTLTLAGSGILIIFTLGPLLGITAALHHNRWPDHLIMGAVSVFSALPIYVLGIFLVIIFSLWLNWLPTTATLNKAGFVMPIATLSLNGIAAAARIARSAMLDTLEQDYIVTARSKGLRERVVIYGHALKNALVPILTTMGTQLGSLVSGAFIVEQVFTLHGLGTYIVTAILNRNLVGIRACVILLALMIGLINIISDVAYACVDPQIRAKYVGSVRFVNWGRRDSRADQ